MSSKGITLSQVARKLGINKSTLHNYCNGIEPKALSTVKLLADYFGVSVQELLFSEKIDVTELRIIGQIEGQFKVLIEKIK